MLLQALLSATLVAAAPPVQLAAGRVTLTGIYNQKGETYLELATAELRQAGLAVLGRAEGGARLGSEEEDRLFGCRDDKAECAAALARALGVQGVVQGTLARVDGAGAHEVVLQVLSADDGRALATSFEGGVDEGDLKGAMRRAARVVAAALTTSDLRDLARTPALSAFTTSPVLRKWAWGILAFAGVSASASGVAAGRRLELLNQPRAEHPLAGTIEQLHEETDQLRQLAVAAGILTGLSLFAWGIAMDLGLQPQPVTPVIALSPGGPSLGLALVF